MAKAKNKIDVAPGSGNVFADLGLPNADKKQTKVRLAFALNQVIRQRHLSQAVAAKALNVNQPRISALANYQLEDFSVGRLMHFLNAAGPGYRDRHSQASLPQGQRESL
ncbi:MAG TPA: helix-turn-helix transcriptional regulator [Candidatus Saccharimonadales bacterium]|jgi:predicted XRE-type DNA-binding protein|nr:helix-turn-helix transcriptional regulator [Candidatus Saccharimonadales bacterium]